MNNEITKCSKVTIDVRYDAVNHKNEFEAGMI